MTEMQTSRFVAAMDGQQFVVGKWAEETFPHSTPESIAAHLADELIELVGAGAVQDAMDRHIARHGAIALANDGSPDVAECADVLLLLMHLCHKRGHSLGSMTEKKHAVNLSRTWQAPDERGVARHQEEAP